MPSFRNQPLWLCRTQELASATLMVYEGYKVPAHGANATIDTVKVQDLDARELWSKYVSQRKPVLIQGHLTDAGWKATAKWNNQYLKKVAGSSQLQVEKRDGPGKSYGQGRKQAMQFGEFLDRMAAGDDTLYLTTQPVADGADGHPELMGPPLLLLQSDFEPRPSLAGNLVPQQINLWMGAAADGASSGLHHDFHDNLYVLIRGRKRFRLFDPSQAGNMYTHGQIRLVHPNGRIVYQGQGEVLPDGSSAQDVELWRQRRAAEQAVAAAELAVQAGEPGAVQRLAQAEAQLEGVLDRELDQMLEDGGSEEWDEDEEDGGRPRAGKQETQDADQPPSFSKVDMALPAKALQRSFPRFPGAAAALECELEAGSMLYLPAGWFHEVSSFSSRAAGGGPGGDGGGHMALNYWFYPPDNLDASPAGFMQPYKCEFLPALWEERTGAAVGGGEAGGSGGAAADGRHPVHHRPFEGVHVDEHEGGTGHSLKIEEVMQGMAGPGKGSGAQGAGGAGKRGGRPAPAGGAQGDGKRRRHGGKGPEEGEEERELQAMAQAVGRSGLSDEQKQQMHDQIKQLLMEGLLARSRGAGRPRVHTGPREFQPPIPGRRHHAVMYVPSRSGRKGGRGGP